ncbi:MAG TPA: tyrosine-type recombinase/integrase, partial [Herpetosiphonaceae bacterium]|nr:tyrosine-type recombinase/integrase [Herpetosiphonaceae bacterium]
KRLAERAGVTLPGRPLHAFRHYAAQNWVKERLSDLAIKQLMRHSSLVTTQIYTRLDTDDLARLHEASSPVDRLLAQAGVIEAD